MMFKLLITGEFGFWQVVARVVTWWDIFYIDLVTPKISMRYPVNFKCLYRLLPHITHP
jgi:hypothetical protein